MVLLLAACSEVQSQHRTTGGIRSLADMGISPAGESCLASFAGPVTLLDHDYGYRTTKIATLIEGNLIRMRNMPGPFARRKPLGDRSVSGYGEFLKTRRRGDQVPKLVMRNNVLAFEDPPEVRKLQTKFNGAHVEIVACANNTILSLGSGPFPGSLPDNWENCFIIIGSSEAQERWDSLRAQWIDAHPDIPRL